MFNVAGFGAEGIGAEDDSNDGKLKFSEANVDLFFLEDELLADELELELDELELDELELEVLTAGDAGGGGDLTNCSVLFSTKCIDCWDSMLKSTSFGVGI